MKLEDAREVLNEVDGKGYTWLKAWGISTIREAVRTVKNRVSATPADKQRAEQISCKLSRNW